MIGRTLVILTLCAGLAVVGCGDSDDSTTAGGDSTATTESPSAAESGAVDTASKPKVTPPQGPPPQELIEKELVEGTGAEAKSGDQVTVQYVGVDYKTGKEFDSSWDRNEPFTFTLGAGEVIRGWDVGIEGMKVGGRRELTIPPDLAYGAAGTGPIGPNATLVFVVDLLAVN